MMRQIRFAVACLTVLFVTAGQLQAAIVTFSDRSLWESAVATFTTTDFNSEATGTFSLRDFGGFSVGESSSRITLAINDSSAATDVDGSNHLAYDLGLGFSTDIFHWLFDSPISSFGFDWVTLPASFPAIENNITVTINELSFDATPAAGVIGGSGFFGVIDSVGTFSTVHMEDGIGVFNNGVGFDNVSYGTTIVPEPSSLALLATGVLGLFGYGYRRRKPATASVA